MIVSFLSFFLRARTVQAERPKDNGLSELARLLRLLRRRPFSQRVSSCWVCHELERNVSRTHTSSPCRSLYERSRRDSNFCISRICCICKTFWLTLVLAFHKKRINVLCGDNLSKLVPRIPGAFKSHSWRIQVANPVNLY